MREHFFWQDRLDWYVDGLASKFNSTRFWSAFCAACIWWSLGVRFCVDDVLRAHEWELGHCSDHVFSVHRCRRKWRTSSLSNSVFLLDFVLWLCIILLNICFCLQVTGINTLEGDMDSDPTVKGVAIGCVAVLTIWNCFGTIVLNPKSQTSPPCSLHFESTVPFLGASSMGLGKWFSP